MHCYEKSRDNAVASRLAAAAANLLRAAAAAAVAAVLVAAPATSGERERDVYG